ncbi:hypothetical protein AB0K48_16385, partial [Nonomuraea sp. NPDC055795]
MADLAVDELVRYARGLPFAHGVEPTSLSRSARPGPRGRLAMPPAGTLTAPARPRGACPRRDRTATGSGPAARMAGPPPPTFADVVNAVIAAWKADVL